MPGMSSRRNAIPPCCASDAEVFKSSSETRSTVMAYWRSGNEPAAKPDYVTLPDYRGPIRSVEYEQHSAIPVCSKLMRFVSVMPG